MVEGGLPGKVAFGLRSDGSWELVVKILGAKRIPGRGTAGVKALRHKNTWRCSTTDRGAKKRGEDNEVGVRGDCVGPCKPSQDFGFYSAMNAVSGLEQRSGIAGLAFRKITVVPCGARLWGGKNRAAMKTPFQICKMSMRVTVSNIFMEDSTQIKETRHLA